MSCRHGPKARVWTRVRKLRTDMRTDVLVDTHMHVHVDVHAHMHVGMRVDTLAAPSGPAAAASPRRSDRRSAVFGKKEIGATTKGLAPRAARAP